MENVERKYGNKITFSENIYHASENADALLICTEWSIFRTPDFNKLKSNMNNPAIFDGRNLYTTNEMKELGFDYLSIGRNSI
jgi:UDPglucose 6-dehydrogenase